MRKKLLAVNGTFHLLSLVLLFLFSPVITASCQTKKAEAPAWDGKPGEFKAAVLGTLRPGEPFVVAVSGAVNGVTAGSAKMQAVLLREEKQLNKAVFFNMGEVSSRGPVYTAIMAVPSTSGFGKAVLRIEAQGRLIKTMELTIEERHFATESFTITPAMTDILTQPDPEKTRQAEQMWAIWIKTGEDIYTTGNFIMPVKSTVQTSIFGTRRVYKYPNGTSSSSIHSGVDWRAPKGTPISAPAPGKVALAMNRITTGNTVVIEHMPGVYSLYFHMDKLAVNAGDMVQTGMKLGEAGATGFATAAHLHWEIRVAAENTDPACFLGRAILDKKAILTILNE
jgi:hypothetical protein